MDRFSKLFFNALAYALVITSVYNLANSQAKHEVEQENESPEGRMEAYYGSRAYPFGKIPQGARRKAMEYDKNNIPTFSRLAEKRNSLFSANSWQMIGPNEVGGRVNDIAVHPTDGKTVWIAAADGGVWKSTNRGDDWVALMQYENAIAMGAIAVAKTNPNLLYAGTGEQTGNVDAYEGAGLFKSNDGGANWQLAGLTTCGAIARIIINPTDPNKLYVAATKNNGGVYKTDNGGTTWTRLYDSPTSDIIANPQNWNEIWFAASGKGIFYSSNAGATLEERRTGIGTDGENRVRISLAIPKDNANVIYAVSYETKGSPTSEYYGYIYKSTNKGELWSQIYSGNNFMGNQGWYNNCIAVKPDNPNIIIAGGQTTMVRTTDGGKTWNQTGTTASVHADHHAFAFDPANPDILYCGHDGGVSISENAGQGFSTRNNNLAITQFYAMGINQKQPNITYGGTQDNGTLTQSSVAAGAVFGGDGFYVGIDHKNPDLIYVENPNGNITRLNVKTRQSKNVTPPESPADQDHAAWSAPLLVDPVDNTRIFSGREKLYISLNQGDSWIAATENFRSSSKASAIGVSSIDNNIIIVGTENGSVYISKDGAETWKELTFKAGMPNRGITDFAMSKKNKNVIYMTCTGFFTDHIFRSDDLGESWQQISMNMPDIPVMAIALHPDDENIVYAGTDIGMYITTDGGKNWASYNENLPRVGVADLEIHVSSKTLRMASHGRSMWEIGLEKASTPPEVVRPAGGEIWMGGLPQLISWNGFVGTNTVKVDYSLDNGQTWKNIAQNVAGNNMRWNLPDVESEVARIKISSEQIVEQTAVSRSFTIIKYKKGGIITSAGKPMITYGIVYDGEYLYSTDFASNLMIKMDPNTFETKEEIRITGAQRSDSLFTDLAYVPERGTFFVHRLESSTPGTGTRGWLYEMDKKGKIKRTYQSDCQYPIGLAWLGTVNPDIPYLLATDRNLSQDIFLVDPDNGKQVVKLTRQKRVDNGPRGATVSSKQGVFYQVITDFTGGTTLQKASADELSIEDGTNQNCSIQLDNTGATINARGIEFDPKDKNFWISDYSGNIYKIVGCEIIRGVNEQNSKAIPSGVVLMQNAPNPFATETNISFNLPKSMQVKVVITDVRGKLIMNLADKIFEKGENNLTFSPVGLASGTYTYSLVFGNGATISKSMVLVK